ncbi:hypothetical protein CEXT_369131 [Caerostris extrusa]|uniref:Uncharacterized protein n=1 Tax=Caerostris extrusa TaxID=172846 RepID=A0AAV4QXE2_CAEEX|nr:hypothetical protein CEXT_369131 [Caerostris extrusa]
MTAGQSQDTELLKQQQEAVEEEILRITTTLKNRLNDLGQSPIMIQTHHGRSTIVSTEIGFLHVTGGYGNGMFAPEWIEGLSD